MKASRKSFVAATAAAGMASGLVRFPAEAAEFTYKYGNPVPPDHPLTVYALKAAAQIKAETGGRVDIQVFPNSQLGSELAMLGQLRSGAIELADLGDSIMASALPLAGISSVPFIFDSYAQAWDTMGGALGKYVRDAVAKTLDLYTLETPWDAGFRQMVTGVRPIVVPDDLRGLKMRVPQTPLLVAMFKGFDASATTVAAAEMYTALQTRLVDGIELPLVSVETFKIYEVQKYVSMTNHMWTGHMLHANAAAWQRLPSALRDIVERNFNTAGIAERSEIARGETALAINLKAQGMLFNSPDPAPFKARLRAAGLYAQWRDAFGPDVWALLEKSVGKLT